MILLSNTINGDTYIMTLIVFVLGLVAGWYFNSTITQLIRKISEKLS